LFVNFESRTGKILVIADLLREGALAKPQAVADANFRRDNKLSWTEGFSEQGYNFPGNRFRLNDNFGVGEKSWFDQVASVRIGYCYRSAQAAILDKCRHKVQPSRCEVAIVRERFFQKYCGF
jgi:hypothetical protein